MKGAGLPFTPFSMTEKSISELKNDLFCAAKLKKSVYWLCLLYFAQYISISGQALFVESQVQTTVLLHEQHDAVKFGEPISVLQLVWTVKWDSLHYTALYYSSIFPGDKHKAGSNIYRNPCETYSKWAACYQEFIQTLHCQLTLNHLLLKICISNSFHEDEAYYSQMKMESDHSEISSVVLRGRKVPECV